jgi:hypothetical protein
MPLDPQKSQKCMGGRHAACANISDTRYTTTPWDCTPNKKRLLKSDAENGASHPALSRGLAVDSHLESTRYCATRNPRWVAAGVCITLVISSRMCSPPKCSNIRVPPPNSTGTRGMEISSTSPAPMYCCPISAHHGDVLVPDRSLGLLQRALDAVGDEGVDAPPRAHPPARRG